MAKSNFVVTSNVNGEKLLELHKVRDFLRRFGYLSDSTRSDNLLDETTKSGILRFQETMGLQLTGSLDEQTIGMMESPRCGVPDLFPEIGINQSSRYVFVGCSFQSKKRILTYAFDNATADIAGDGEREAIRKSFKTWQDVISIDFIEVDSLSSADFRIAWHEGNHGDGSSFDGAGNILAHAFFPASCGGVHAGKCHFDEAETWGIGHQVGVRDVETVALHEIGHLLGLAHSSSPNAVMYASYSGQLRTLSQDDIDGIQSVYGKRGPELRILVHLEAIGDVKRRENEFAGTRGQSRRLEGFQIEVAQAIPNLSLRYMAHLQGIGDVPFLPEGQFIGTRGQSRRLEGFAIELTGSAAPNYNVKYMAHLQNIGDTGIFQNGAFCGTRGQSRRVEGILVRIEKK